MKKTSVLNIGIVLVALYIGAQCVADVAATRIVRLGTIVLPSGTLMFALTFTLRDMLHKKLGRQATIITIVMGAIVNLLLSSYLVMVGAMNAPPFFALDAEWQAVFAWVPSITIGSILAEMVSEWVDTEVYEFWVRKVTRRYQWSRVLVSNAAGLIVDSITFGTLAFTVLPLLFGGESLSIVQALSLGTGQIVYKGLVTVASLPLIYSVKDGAGLIVGVEDDTKARLPHR